MDGKPCAALADDLALVNDRLSHTVWRVEISAEADGSPDRFATHPLSIALTLHSDEPTDPIYSITCCGLERAIVALWQLCAIGLWQFSLEAFPPPPWDV